jgi:hypothetical protein
MKLSKMLYFLAMLAMLFCAALSQPISAAEEDEFNYVDSNLSNSDYGMTTLLSGNQVGGCSVISLKAKPPLFFMMLAGGDGTLSVVSRNYKISATKRVSTIKLNIGRAQESKVLVVDGNTATFDLTKAEIDQAAQATMSINGVVVDGKTYKALHALAPKCISAD